MTQLRPVIRVAAEEWVPYTKLYYDNGTQDIAGPMKHFLVEFCRMLGARYEVVRPPDGLWGKPLENGSYSGMMGLLMTGQADFALGPFVYSWWREALADLTTPFYYIQYHVLSPRPVVPSDPAGIVKTFSFQVWLLVAVCLAVVGVAMMGMMWVANKFQWNTRVAPAWWAAEWSFQGAVQQSTPWLPGNASGRVLVAVWLLSALVIATTYKGNITAMLTLPKTDVPIDSLADLAYQDRLPWKLELGGIDKIMMESDDKATQKVGSDVSGFIHSCWSARDAIRAGEFASVCDRLSILSMMSWDFRVMRLTEAGLWDEWLGWELANATDCLKPPSADLSGDVKPLGLLNMLGVIILLAAGYIVSVLTFAGEMLHLRLSSQETASGRPITPALG